MRWAMALAAGLTLGLAAGAASACEGDHRCPPGHGYDAPAYPSGDRYEDGGGYQDFGEARPPLVERHDAEPVYEGERYADWAVWRDERGGLYMHGYRAAPCRCKASGAVSYERREVRLSDSFFADAGGVGPIPSDGYYYGGGGYVIVGSGAHASALASASARASVSVRYRGGFKGGGCCHGGGHKGGKRH